MNIKITTSKYWKRQTILILVLDVLITLAVIIYLIINGNSEDFFVLGGYVLVYLLFTFISIYSVRRLLTAVVVNDADLTSVLFNKKIAVVNNRETVYYALFEESEGVYSRSKFILISNSYFKYIPRKSVFSKNIIGSYDMHTQILLPYNSDTMKLCDLQNWICVN